MIDSINEFCKRVNQLDDISNAYILFEDECTDQLRDLIYACADRDVYEPFRSAMHNLGFDSY